MFILKAACFLEHLPTSDAMWRSRVARNMSVTDHKAKGFKLPAPYAYGAQSHCV